MLKKEMIDKANYWINRLFWRKIFRMCIKPKKHTIICNNCRGGVLYSEMGEQFSSPTINCFIYEQDFVKFVAHIKEYINQELYQVVPQPFEFPTGGLKNKYGEVQIHFNHAKTFADAKEQWDRRKKRIDYDKIYVIMAQIRPMDGDVVEDFLNITYPKIYFTSMNYSQPDCKQVPWESSEGVGYIGEWSSIPGIRRDNLIFNYIKFLNQ